MSRGWLHLAAAGVATAGLTAAACGTLLAQALTWDLDLAIGKADRMYVALTGVTGKGYRCARVARPDGGFVPQHVAILMARPRQSGVVPKTSGVTMAESSLIGRQAYGLVAVMERLEQRAASGVS